MAIISSSGPPERRAGLGLRIQLAVAVGGLLAVSLLSPAGMGIATADAQEAADRPAASPPSLPAAPNRVGRIRRDKDGRIVPDGPPLPPDENATRPRPPDYFPGASYLTPPPSAPGQALPYDTSYLQSLQDRQLHAERARERQAEIDRIMREAAIMQGKEGGSAGLTPRETALVRDLKRKDDEVRQREMRRYRMAQPYAAHPEFWFVTGPDGRQYAAAGMARLDAEMIGGDPATTLRKLEILRRASLAPLIPAPEDHLIVQELERLILVIRQRLYGAR